MKYRLLFFVVFILACVAYAECFYAGPCAEYLALRDTQPNPFRVQRDSAEEVWGRAKQFLDINHRLIAAGDLVEKDSILFIPYGSPYDKGNSIRIERKMVGDSVEFRCYWWYSLNEEKGGGKEIALYMQTGRSRR